MSVFFWVCLHLLNFLLFLLFALFLRFEKLKRRNILEMEGYNNEAVMLRLRLSHIERVCPPVCAL
jgi:hypothetical protein